MRVSAGAFGPGLPLCDLWMSPGHNVFADGLLMPIRTLINGVTVSQVPVPEVTYWHVELDSHDVILAEGLPAESYRDTGNRVAFENGGAAVQLHPDFEPRDEVGTCAPLVKSGPAVAAVRAALLLRAAALGHRMTAMANLHLLADGQRVDPIWLDEDRAAFILDADCRSILMNSRTFVPCQCDPASGDSRVLGIKVRRLQIDDQETDLQGSMPGPGWHALEQCPHHVQRWTNGAATLPSGAHVILVDLSGHGRYWAGTEPPVALVQAC